MMLAMPKPPTKMEKPPMIQPASPTTENNPSKPCEITLASLRAKSSSVSGANCLKPRIIPLSSSFI